MQPLTRLLDRRVTVFHSIAYTISKDENNFFMKLWYNQSDQHACTLLASLARVLRFALTKIFGKLKCVSIDSKCSETHRNAKKKKKKKKKMYPFDRLRASRVAQSPSGVAQWNFNTINRTWVPTLSPSFIKIQLIVTEISALIAGQTDKERHKESVR